MIVRYPKRFEPGSRRDDFADLVDLLPTVADVCAYRWRAPRRFRANRLRIAPG